MKHSPQTIKAFVVAVIIAALISAITILASDNIGSEGGKAFSIAVSFIIYSLIAAPPLVVAEKKEYNTLGLVGMFLAGMGFVSSAIGILTEPESVGFLKFIFTIFLLSLGLSHICLLHHFNIQNKYAGYARITATIAISLFTLLLVVQIFDSMAFYDSFLYSPSTYKIILVAFIIDLAATALVPLCNRLEVPEKVEINFETPPADEPEKKDQGV